MATSDFVLLSKVTEQINRDPEVAFTALAIEYSKTGPYAVAKKYGVLVDGSGEDFAIEFMTFSNSQFPGTY